MSANSGHLPLPPTGRGSDWDRCISLLCGLAADLSQVQFLTIPGIPPSKSRPRFGRGGHAYTSAESRAAERRTAAQLRSYFQTPHEGNVALACVFFRPNRQRIDADNLLKHICDAANGIVWRDDSQVTAILGVVELDPDAPRTLVAVGPHVTSMTRGQDATVPCVQCGAPMSLIGRARTTQTCSTDCSLRMRGVIPLSEPVPCIQCSQPFRRTTYAQKMCSPKCRADALRGRNKSRGNPPSNCQTCGKQLSHRRGGQCRECWKANPVRIEARR